MKKISRFLTLALTLCMLLSCVVVFSLSGSAEVGIDESGWAESLSLDTTPWYEDGTLTVNSWGTTFNGYGSSVNGPPFIITGMSFDGSTTNTISVEDGVLTFTRNGESGWGEMIQWAALRSVSAPVSDNVGLSYTFYYNPEEEAFCPIVFQKNSNEYFLKVQEDGQVVFSLMDNALIGRAGIGWNTLSLYFILGEDDTYDVYAFLDTPDSDHVPGSGRTDAEMESAVMWDAGSILTKETFNAVDGNGQRTFIVRTRFYPGAGTDGTPDAPKYLRIKDLTTYNLTYAVEGSAGPADKAEMYGASLTLGAQPEMSYYVAASEVPEGYTPSMKVGNDSLAAPTTVKLDGTDYYKFVAPIDYADFGVRKTVALYLTGSAGIASLQDSKEYGIADYAANLYTAEGTSASLKSLLEAIVYYGDYAGNNTNLSTAFAENVTANGGSFTVDADAHVATYEDDILKLVPEIENENYEGFLSDFMTGLSIRFATSNPDAVSAKILMNGETFEVTADNGEFNFDGFDPLWMNRIMTVTLLDADGNEIEGSTVVYSMANIIAAGIETDANLAKSAALYMSALYAYYETTLL